MSFADIDLPPIDPPLMIRNGLVLAASFNALATPAASPLTNVMALGPIEQFGETVDACLLGAEASQCVLVHLVLAAALAQLTRNVASCPTLMPRYSVMIAASAAVELGGDLVDDGDFLGTGVLSCHVHLLSLLLGVLALQRTPRGARHRCLMTRSRVHLGWWG